MRLKPLRDTTTLLLITSIVAVLSLFGYVVLTEKEINAYHTIHSEVAHLELIDHDFDTFSLDVNAFKHYGVINNEMEDFEAVLAHLNKGIAEHFSDTKALLEAEHATGKAFEEKRDDLEYFKAQNSTVMNISHVLFDLQETIREDATIPTPTKRMVNETLFYLLKYLSTIYISRDVVETRIDKLGNVAKEHHQALLTHFFTHTRLMLQTLDSLRSVASQIQHSPLHEALDRMHHLLDTTYAENLRITKTITALFFIAVIVLILLLLIAHWRGLKRRAELQAFQFAVNHSDNTILITDPDHHITYVNRAFERTSGYRFDEVKGATPALFKSGQHDDAFYADLYRTLDQGDTWNGEFVNKRKDGSLYYERASIVPIFLEGELISFLAIKLDITAYIEQNHKLARAAAIFDQTEEAIIIADSERTLVTTNAAFSKMYGYTPEEIRGKPINFFRAHHHNQNDYEEMMKAIETEGVWRGRIVIRCKNGEEIPVWNTSKKIVETDGSVSYIAVQTDLRSWEISQKKIDYLAYHDPLTGVYNRVRFEEYLVQVLHQARRSHGRLALLFVDLDRFKVVNDTLGHDTGDAMLIQIAHRLRSVLTEQDFLARWGGDEFVILLENLSAPDQAAAVANAMIEAIKAPLHIRNHTLNTTASIGIALFPDNSQEVHTLIQYADSAMYDAKAHGKNRFRFYTEALSIELRQRLTITSALQTALDAHEFSLVFQPQYDLEEHKTVSAEALIRWNSHTLGKVMPDQFIPAAEEDGHIVAIGYYVFASTCRALQRIRERGAPLDHIAVNVASMQFAETDLLERFMALLHTYHLTPKDIVLEITERVAMSPTQENRKKLEAFRQKGFRIAIDDFGVEYSSLSMLKDLPVDTIKIDKLFVDSIGEDPHGDSLVEAIIVLANTMNFAIVAEGIETHKQERFLQDKGCTIGQGYLYSKPVALDALIERLEYEKGCE